jgi:hypothetical protein
MKTLPNENDEFVIVNLNEQYTDIIVNTGSPVYTDILVNTGSPVYTDVTDDLLTTEDTTNSPPLITMTNTDINNTYAFPIVNFAFIFNEIINIFCSCLP